MKALRGKLLRWFARHRRDLPWRRTLDPYRIWVSEIMLQQTQVATVIPYWTRFLKAFPTVEALADAALPDVLAQWSGLGYYSRCRNLHRAAQAVVRDHGGALPRTSKALQELPGFGRYTAGAVASIAFGEPVPAVDGNVQRVLSRLFAVEGAPGDRPREAALWKCAADLALGQTPGDLNQALIELGATLCRPDRPACHRCPASARCRALAEDRVAELPPPRVRPAPRELKLGVMVHWRNGKLLLGRRPEEGLFGGLWELPTAPLDTMRGESLGIVRRTLTHRKLELHLFQAPRRARLPTEGYSALRWASLEEIPRLGMSTAMHKALELITPTRPARAAARP